jgi:hypothetical protein
MVRDRSRVLRASAHHDQVDGSGAMVVCAEAPRDTEILFLQLSSVLPDSYIRHVPKWLSLAESFSIA